ncbi:MAG: hypothetical protein H6865_03605 [Rhodospirillales bacterium]|nr:hypothetical protein [Alphaproteobacteria bacterium]MCB9986703.1 hypothetical protein [Rhodospirillales bacterium]USO06772.1 MAG: hypothetical protein H6866_04780 [Rhodospirillales bacterium]
MVSPVSSSLADIFAQHAPGMQAGRAPDLRATLDAARIADLEGREGVAAEQGIARHLADYFTRAEIPLADDARILLATRLARGGVDALDAEDRDRVYRLISDVNLDPLLARVDTVLKTHFYPSFARSRPFNDAVNEWGEWRQKRKIAYAGDFARHFSRVTGVPLAAIERFEEDRDENGLFVAGKCRAEPGTGGASTVLMNTIAGGALADHRHFDQTQYHELLHTLHNYLAHCAQTGDFSGLHPELREAAPVLALAVHASIYGRIESDAAYEAYSIERHAEAHAQDFGAVMHDPARRLACVEADIAREERRIAFPMRARGAALGGPAQ